MTRPIATALVGCGNSGRHYHLPHLTGPAYDLRAVAVGTPSEAAEVGAAVGPDTDVVVGWESVVARPDVELVVIATPHHLHHPIAKAALEHGKHALVEKPMTMTVAEADDLIATAEAAGLVLMPHQQRHFEADFQALKALLEEGAIGTPWRIQISRTHQGRYRTSTPEKPHVGTEVLAWAHDAACGGGVGRVIGPHPVDQLLTLAASPVTAVDGRYHLDPEVGVEDWLGIDVDFASGLTGHIEIFRRTGIPPLRFAVYGSTGTIIATDATTLEIEQAGTRRTVTGLEPPGVLGAEIYADLAAAIREGKPPRVTAANGRAAVAVIERAYAAAARHRAGAA